MSPTLWDGGRRGEDNILTNICVSDTPQNFDEIGHDAYRIVLSSRVSLLLDPSPISQTQAVTSEGWGEVGGGLCIPQSAAASDHDATCRHLLRCVELHPNFIPAPLKQAHVRV